MLSLLCVLLGLAGGGFFGYSCFFEQHTDGYSTVMTKVASLLAVAIGVVIANDLPAPALMSTCLVALLAFMLPAAASQLTPRQAPPAKKPPH